MIRCDTIHIISKWIRNGRTTDANKLLGSCAGVTIIVIIAIMRAAGEDDVGYTRAASANNIILEITGCYRSYCVKHGIAQG